MNIADIVLRTLIVNSDNRMQRHLQKFIAAEKRLDIVRSLRNGRQLVNYLRGKQEIDLIIINPELPDTSAFEAFKMVPKEELPMIVMISDRHDYAYFAFQMDVVDFLDMPFTPPEFEHSIKKIQQEFKKRELLREFLEQAAAQQGFRNRHN